MSVKQFAVGVFIAAGFLFSVPLVFAALPNLVQNGDLEISSANSTTTPQGWNTDSWGTLSATFTYPVVGKNGGKAAQTKVTNLTSGDAKWYFNNISVTPNTTLTYSDDYSATVATNVTVEFLMSNGSYNYMWLGDALPTAGGAWNTFTGQLVVPAGAVSMTVLHVLTSPGTLIIDNVSVTDGTVLPPPLAPTCTLTANPASITVGSNSVLTFSSQNATTASVDNGVGAVPTSGTKTVSPVVTTLYTGTFVGAGGTTTCAINVTVTAAPPPPTPKPVITLFKATPTSVVVGSSTVLSWSVVSASSTSIDQGVGVVAGSSKSVTPTQTTTYTLTATNPGGSVSTTTTVTITQPPVPPPPATNLIINGNLETATVGSPTIPLGWHADYWGSLTPVFTYPVSGNGSAKAAKINVTNWKSGDAKWWFDHVPVSDNQIYVFKDDYLSNAITNVSVEFKMSNGTYQYQWVANAAIGLLPAGGKVNVQITVPKGAVSMTVLHALTSNGALTIDNASLTLLPANPFPQGMLSFVFDDGLVSQYTNARSILNTAGFKASFGIITKAVRDISGDTAAMTWAQITQLKNDGHEISSHSRTHPDLSLLTSTQAQTEIKGSYDDLVAKGLTPKTFVYPLGGVNATVEQLVKTTGYIGARGSYWGMNSPVADKYALYDIRLDKTTTVAGAKALIDQAFADKRWLVFELHDILASGGDSYAITPTTFQAIVTYAKQKGIKVVTLGEGLQAMTP